MKSAWLSGLATWAAIGIFGYLIAVSFFEWAAGIGLAIWIICQTVEFLGHDRLPDQDRQISE